MKLDKNGYRSEKRSSFSTAVKVLTFIFGVGVVLAIVCLYALFSGCGGGSDNAPVYDENGNGDTSILPEDGIIYPAGDSCNGDTCVPQPQYDTIVGACEAIKAGKKPPEVCMPLIAKEARCIFYNYPTDSNPDCDLSKTDHCWCSGGLHDQDDCSSKASCQVVPCADWPPEVCWGLPCMFVGKWDCPSSVWDYTDVEFYDNGDGYCRIHSPQHYNNDLYFKPGDDHFQRPPSGPFEDKYTIIDGGSQLFNEGRDGFTFTCTKLVEE